MTIWDDVLEQLLATLQATCPDVPLRYLGEPQPLTGGFYAQLIRFQLDDPPPLLVGDLVARIIPDADLGVWEATIQRDVAAAGFSTPGVRLTADPGSPLGRHLIVMEHSSGAPLLGGLGFLSVIRRLPQLYRDLPRMLATITSRLHAIDPTPVAADLAAIGSSVPASAVALVEVLQELADGFELADLSGAASALLETAPAVGELVVCHGDLHPFNVLVDGDRLALLDWTGGRVADPAYDLGFTELTLANPPLAVPAPVARVVRWVGRRLAASFLREYEAASGRTVDPASLAWHRNVHALRILVELAALDDGIRFPGHPWVVLEPAARKALGLRAR